MVETQNYGNISKQAITFFECVSLYQLYKNLQKKLVADQSLHLTLNLHYKLSNENYNKFKNLKIAIKPQPIEQMASSLNQWSSFSL